MRSTWLTRATRIAGALAALAVVVTATAAAKPAPERGVRRSRAMSLFAVTNAVLDVNRVYCGINNLGELCVDPTNSPVVGGGFWPKGTPDQYIFNTGLQLAGIVDPGAGFAWAGDTTGAYFFDARGTQVQGDAITLVYNSLDPADAAAWPNGAVVRDSAIYHPILIGRDNISQQDLWVRAWDGNPALLSGRTHPMGILVEERGVAWNYPSGNQDIIYFIFTFYNVTARNAARYANPTIPPAVQSEIAAIGVQFQDRNEAVFNLDIPDDGYTITSMYASFSADMDVGDAAHNYASAVLPFNMGFAYKADFLERDWAFPPDIFGAPFTAAPGFVGVKYLRSPTDQFGNEIGLAMFSNTRNAATAFPDPVGVRQLYRYLSGTVNPAGGDNPCTFPNPQQRRLCFLDQQDVDTRFFQSSGPLTLPPGEGRTIVVAYVHAAPLALVAPFVGAAPASQLKPQIPFPGDSIYFDASKVRTIDRAVGWVSHSDINGDFVITQDEVVTVPRSLLNKGLVAQAVYDNGFLLPFAPAPPSFFLVPDNNQVTVAWQPSPTETSGDPFFAIASQPLNPDGTANALYNPNFRQFDVEGYRIYRGRTTGDLRLIAQFDYAGSSFIDYTGEFAYIGKCAPELGIQTDCPITFPSVSGEALPIVGDFIQVPPGGRVELASGDVLIVDADTAITGGGGDAALYGFPSPSDNGVGFAYVDRSVRNSFTYYYAVTAFDVNSVASGPSSLESPRITRAVTPRAGSGQTVVGALGTLEAVGGDGSVLSGSMPTLDPATGIFSGPMPPADGASLGLVAFLPEVLTTGQVTLTIDSVTPGAGLNGRTGVYYMTAQGSGAPTQLALPVNQDPFNSDFAVSIGFPATNMDQGKAVPYGGDSTYALYGSATISMPGTWLVTGWARGSINGAPPNSDHNGPRWWDGTPNENVSAPNSSHCPGSPGGCVQTPLTKTAGGLTGVSVLFHPLSYATVPNVPGRNMEALTSYVARAADFRVYWGAAGAVDSVVDVVHRVPVPFSPAIRASWGILNNSGFAGFAGFTGPRDANNSLLTWSDFYCVAPARAYLGQCGLGGTPAPAATVAVLEQTAALNPIAAAASTYAGTATQTATGNGFIFYIAGHYFLMQMAALPAAGTVWNMRSYSGVITGTDAAADYAFTAAIRPSAVPGLRYRVTYTGSTFNPAVTTDANLARVHTVPDPYYVTSSLEISQNTKLLKFVNMPARAILRIYSQSGVLVQVLTHNDPTGGGEVTWNLRNRNNQFVASGVYFYHVETPDGKKKVGRFTVVNFAQ